MAVSFLSTESIDRLTNRTCREKILIIIESESPMNMRQIFEVLTDETTLGDLKVSSYRCDHGLRGQINDEIRSPKGWPALGRGTIKTSKAVKSLIEENC